ncbi:MAG TPA: (Fe-S)-binding protein [Streptosporangiaceae bacterium]|nr:(Fe-S)-binding protein [Streptosporangiaceae bacterium]
MRVGLFVTCVNDTLYPRTGRAVVRLLERLGCTVEFPLDQTCCGQMHFNTGYRADARRLARRFAETFSSYEAVVVPSGSCAAMVREWYPSLDVPVPSAYELTEFLVDVLGVEDVGAYFPHRVTYHPTCHSLRTLRLGDRPARLLSRVRGLDLAELPSSDECCGFGGTFALKNPAVSAAMCADKVRNVAGTGAEVLCAADNSCLMHIGGALARQRTGVRVLHLAEILAATEEDPV